MIGHDEGRNFPGAIPPPLGVTPNLTFSQSRVNIAIHALCIVVTTLFVVSRIYTKSFVVRRIDGEDCT